jgi:hypothetical protein
MHADYSVELGRDDPALELPWSADDPSVCYYDLKKSPELVLQVPEAVAYPELGAFLARINAPGFPLATAKCDVWYGREIASEEEIFGADRKFASYIDLVFADEASCCSFEKHEEFARELCRLLSHAPDIAATVEVVVRRCHYHQASFDSLSGFCLTAYVTGFGDNEHEPRRRWEIALTLLQHALVQLTRT